MSITASDIVIYESERMTDEDNGGGLPTGKILPDSTTNALFAKTSRMDRTQGRTNLIKVFCGVKTNNTEVYQGSHFIIDRDAQDAHTNMLAFPGTSTDTREEARARIEQYLVPGYDTRMFILGDAYVGQRSIILFMDTAASTPDLGDTLCLKGVDPDNANEYEEFIKISSMTLSSQVFTYEYNNQFNTITRRVLTISLSTRLKNRWYGGQPYPTGAKRTDPVKPASILTTAVADASRYYGVSTLKVSAASGDPTIKVSEVYKSIVPSAYAENGITNKLALSEIAQLSAVGTTQARAYAFALVSGSQSRTHLERVPVRGSLSLDIDGGVYRDLGDGVLVHQSGTDNFSKIVVDFESGQIDAYRTAGAFTGSAAASWVPAARIVGAAISFAIPVTVANRTFTWTRDLSANIPEPGTLTVMYRALGKWQLLQDDGTGQLTGNGTGTVSFLTGSLSLSLTAMPDADSQMVVSYIPQGSLDYSVIGGQSKSISKTQLLQTTNAMSPGSLTISWMSGGQSKSVHDNGAGVLSGDGSGDVSYARKKIQLASSDFPDDGNYHITYLRAPSRISSIAIPESSASLATFNAGVELVPGKNTIEYSVTRYSVAYGGFGVSTVKLTDDGAGHLLRDGEQVGTINYTNGSGSFVWSKPYSYTVVSYSSTEFGPWQKNTETISSTETNGTSGSLMALTVSASSAVTDDLTITMQPLEFSLGDNLIAGSLWFSDNGNDYIERDGVVWKNPDERTGAGVRVGHVSYQRGQVYIDDPRGITGQLTLISGGLMMSRPYVTSVTFRTPGSPLKPANLQLFGSDSDGSNISASVDADGNIQGSGVTGTVNIQQGLVVASFNKPISAESLRYNTVILTSIPLDSTTVGLDPIRLPSDGKVPIYQDGEIVVLTHSASFTISTPSAGQVIDAGRDYLADCYFVGANKRRLSPAQYTEDRDAGIITLSPTLSLVDSGGYAVTTPLTFYHKIEHMSLLRDVQVNGDLTLAIPLYHDFPADETMVSSALRMGDRFASWGVAFVQQTWSNANPNWGDSPEGAEIIAAFDWANYPLEVTNQGAVDDDWALVFTSQTTFDIISKYRGKIDSSSINVNAAPINPNTGTPYFILDFRGFSEGWVNGNVIRFTTISALFGVWLLRCISVGIATHPDDSMSFQQRGDS